MDKRYRRYKWIPFKEPQPESIRQKIRRSDNPLKTSIELGVVDKIELIKIKKHIDRII